MAVALCIVSGLGGCSRPHADSSQASTAKQMALPAMSESERETHARVKTVASETLVREWQRNSLAFWQEYTGIWKITGTVVRVEGNKYRPVLVLAGPEAEGRTKILCRFISADELPQLLEKLTMVSPGDYLMVIGSMFPFSQTGLEETDCAVVVGAFDLWRPE